MITITVSGPTKSGKSLIVQTIMKALEPLGDSVKVDGSVSIRVGLERIALQPILKGTTIRIMEITNRKDYSPD